MKEKGIRFFAPIIITFFLAFGFTVVVYAYPSGSPAGYTGSPGDTHHCVSCHGGSAVAVSGWITTNIPPAGYTPGSSYTITVTATGSGKKGFELSPQNIAGTQLGVLAAGTGSHLIGGTKYVTQSSAGPSSGTSTWSFNWTAPATGTGTVTLYTAFTVGKTNTKLESLDIIENPAMPLAASATATPSLICAGQTSQLDVTASGGSGTYTYLWSSVPPGFSSTLKNPVAAPAVSTQYSVQVSDGTGSVDAGAQVTVNQPATAFAGNNSTLPATLAPVPLNGTATNYSSVLWTTSGTGTFSAASQLTGFYNPSPADLLSINITLTLTATPQVPCTTPASGDLQIHFDNTSGIAGTPGGQPELVLSPNPTTGLFTLRTSLADAKEAGVMITDLRGKMVMQFTLIPSVAQPKQIDMSGFPKGMYLVKVQTENESRVRKLLMK